MQEAFLMALGLLVFDIVITSAFAAFLVQAFENGQKAMLVYLEHGGQTRALRVYDNLSFIERLGCIIMHGSTMTKCMIALTLPCTGYTALMLGESMERTIHLMVLVLEMHTIL